MNLVCLDTHVLIWGVKEQAEPGQEDMIPKAKAFLDYLDEKQVKALVPSVVVAELMTRIPLDLHATMLNLLAKRFLVMPFDLQAAARYGEIWQTNKVSNNLATIRQEFDTTRETLKADCMIIATAIIHNAFCIYSHDGPLQRLAEGLVDVREIPSIPTQLDLFEQAEA